MIGLVLGFLSPFLPDVIKLFAAKGERAHELAVLRAQVEINQQNAAAANQQSLHRMEESTVKGEFDAIKAAYTFADRQSYRWVDAIASLTRPTITFSYFILYAGVKVAQYLLALSATGDWKYAVTTIWGPADMETFNAVIGFWFGYRSRTKANA